MSKIKHTTKHNTMDTRQDATCIESSKKINIEKYINGCDLTNGHIMAKQDKNNNTDADSSIISDYSDDEDNNKYMHEDDMEKEAKEKYVKDVVCDKIVKYVKIDKILSDKQSEFTKEIKPIKDAKKSLQEFLCKYLDDINEEYFNVKDKRYTKTTKQTKKPIKLENIVEGLRDDFAEHEIFNDEKEMDTAIQRMIKKIDGKRETSEKKYLKRSNIKK